MLCAQHALNSLLRMYITFVHTEFILMILDTEGNYVGPLSLSSKVDN